MQTEFIDNDYLNNVVLLLKQDGFVLDFIKDNDNVLLTISKDGLSYRSMIKKHMASAELAEKIVTTMSFLMKRFNAKCEEYRMKCEDYLEFTKRYPSVRQLQNQIQKTASKLNVLRLTWYARRRAEYDKTRKR